MYYSAHLRNKAFINHILRDTLFKPKCKNEKIFTLNQSLNSVWPTILFISMFVYKNFFSFRGESCTAWKFYVLQCIQNISLSPGLNQRFNSSTCCRLHVLSTLSLSNKGFICKFI